MFCWNPQDFHFCINYRFSDGLRPSWPQRLCSVEFLLSGKLIEQLWKIKRLFPPSFELGTFRVWGERDDHYTTETCSQDWGTFPSLASWNTTQTTDCVALFNLQIPSIFSSKLKKIPVFCWNPQDFHFCINYRFSDGLRPSWPQSLCSVEFLLSGKLIEQLWKIKRLFPPSFELWTFRVLGERDNHYTTETCSQDWVCLFHRTLLGTRIKLQIALHSLICKYLLFLAANKKNSSVLLESSRLSFLHQLQV